MSIESITKEVSKRICKHMNKDHVSSLIIYAQYYARITNPIHVEMIEITEKAMYLNVDNKKVEIKFDHVLKDSKDAHSTLVAMLKAVPS